MSNTEKRLIQAGNWSDSIAWELFETTTLPPAELCTAVMCVAVSEDKIVLACSERGWGLLGGHIEDGESLDAALRRESYEEGGFIINEYQLFAVRKITASTPISHPRPGKKYPYPISYIAYYWATTARPLELPTGEEIIESGSFTLNELDALNTPDQPAIEAGWKAYIGHGREL